MVQTTQSGAAANTFGRETAPKIAREIGAAMTGPQSNEAILDGKHVVIKCAGKHTTSIGVTYTMLKKLDAVIGAFQHKTGAYQVFSLPAAVFAANARDSASASAHGRVGLVTKKVFEAEGKLIKVVRLYD